MNTPLITIGITCYNEGEWLLECWQSLLAQTNANWQAIIVLDGTPHAQTRDIFQHLEHPQLLKFAFSENMGAYPAANKVFEMADTDYVFLMAGDDLLPSDAIANLYEAIRDQPTAAFIYGDYEWFGDDVGVRLYPHSATPDDLVEKQCLPGACVYQRPWWRKLGGFSSELARGNGDYDFYIGLLEAGAQGYHCGQVIYRYRVGHASVSKSYNRHYYLTHEIMVQRHPLFFANKQRRDRFLGLGYQRSAWANYWAGDLSLASKLARQSIQRGLWLDLGLWTLALQITPLAQGYDRFRKTWHSSREKKAS